VAINYTRQLNTAHLSQNVITTTRNIQTQKETAVGVAILKQEPKK
jgi:hypothetical protein